jgi:hypothetical protein
MGPKQDIKRQNKLARKIRARTDDMPTIDDLQNYPTLDIDAPKKLIKDFCSVVFADMRKDKNLNLRQKMMLLALFYNKGLVTPACYEAKVPLGTHCSWLSTNQIYKTYTEQVKEYVQDIFEGVLYNKAEGGNMEALKMVLNAKAGDRGYAKESVTTNITVPTQFNVTFVKPGEVGESSDYQVGLLGVSENTPNTESIDDVREGASDILNSDV